MGFSAFRDQSTNLDGQRKSRKKSNGNDMDDSEEDDDDNDVSLQNMADADDKIDESKLAPDDAKFSGELADGVNRIRVCSLDPKAVQEPSC